MESRYSATVVGLHYYKGTEGLSIGAPVILRCDPGNAYDSNAVAVFRVDQTMIGHLKRDQAAIASPLLQQGVQVNATIRSVHPEKPARCEITMTFPSALPQEPAPQTTAKTKSKDCFVATAVFQSPDHPVVVGLRLWRDNVLRSSRAGRMFIGSYNAVGPKLAELVRRFPSSRPILRGFLAVAVKAVNQNHDI
jgi:hypothetical protein